MRSRMRIDGPSDVVCCTTKGVRALLFRAQMTVLLNQPLQVSAPDEQLEAIGYMIIITVNAADVAVAVQIAQEAALRPKQADGSLQSFEGIVIAAEVNRIDLSAWEPAASETGTQTDPEGVYHSTGPMFFPAENKGSNE